MLGWLCFTGYIFSGHHDLSGYSPGIDVPLIDKDRKASARVAQIHDFIENDLPNGYNTSVGERNTFTGGQRRAIGIARALFKLKCFSF